MKKLENQIIYGKYRAVASRLRAYREMEPTPQLEEAITELEAVLAAEAEYTTRFEASLARIQAEIGLAELTEIEVLIWFEEFKLGKFGKFRNSVNSDKNRKNTRGENTRGENTRGENTKL